jgi:hypothetical protein
MKKNIIIPILLSLFIFVGCVEDLPQTSMVEIEPGSTYLSLRSSQITVPVVGTEVESITLNSLRILVFKKEGGQIVTNKKFDITALNAIKQDDGSWIADFSGFVATTNPGESVVYAVLNEDVSQVSGHSLTTALNGVTTLTGMQNLVNTPLTYIPLRVVYDNGKPVEPPFVMVSFGEVNILPSQLNHADLRGLGGDSKGFAMDRTMAKVTVSKVTSEPYAGYVGTTDNVKTSYIFILKMKLVNVPTQYLWSPNRLQTPPLADPVYTVPPPAYTGTYETIDFELEDPALGYYTRDWNGELTANVTVNVTWRQGLKGVIYKIADNSGNSSYAYTELSIDNPAVNPAPFKFPPSATPAINSGNPFLKFLKDHLMGDAASEFNLGAITYDNNPQVTTQITGGYWTLDQDISFYVPEHILQNNTETANATKLYVKAAIASDPVFDPSNVSYDEGNIVWTNGGENNNPQWTYPTVVDIEAIAGNFVKIPVPGDPENRDYHVWEGYNFYRVAKGKITVPLTAAQFSSITNSKNIKEFYLPIKNNVPEGAPADYNIYRNNEYKFSVHVLEQWPLSAPSGASSQASTRSSWEDPNQSMVLRIVPE